MIDYLRQRKKSDEVYHSVDKSFDLTQLDIKNLVDLADQSERKRIRFCTHLSAEELVHQMFIVHPKGAYVRPHKHTANSESILVLEGEVDYVIFDENGDIDSIVRMGDYRSNKPFYQTIEPNLYHTLLIRSNWLIFLEVIEGPFLENDKIYSDWSPLESDRVEVAKYVDELFLK
jgi:cupin fold WbuC family metalloprotein